MIARVWRAPVVEGRLFEYERFVHEVVVPRFKCAQGGILGAPQTGDAFDVHDGFIDESHPMFF